MCPNIGDDTHEAKSAGRRREERATDTVSDRRIIICGIELISLMRGDVYSCETQLSNCSCVTNFAGWILDLSPLDSETNGGSPFSVNNNGVIYT